MKFTKLYNIITFAVSVTLLLSSCSDKEPVEIEKGVTQQLAASRYAQLSDVKYKLNFSIPEKITESINAEIVITAHVKNTKIPLVLDFNEDKKFIKSIHVNGDSQQLIFSNGHIVIPSDSLKSGLNSISVNFIAGELSLNRNPEYLYTLFVPDRASTAFPCFDQPDIKAEYNLTLEIPVKWVAVANGKVIEEKLQGNRKICIFGKTEPLSTYLFSFVAGKFEKITRKFKEREISIYHRETNKKRLNNNVDTIFNTLFDSLKWMEDYTEIKYPFAKYDLIAIPSFQYGGMEHTGATLYRASKLFLEETATITQKLARANLIAHETAHMWFGDLVTMKWFSDVWMKEVFANFMADKIVNPWFKDINHKLRFLFSHYPKAWSIDRTTGANPIAQKLENMNDAGSLYGQIIYHKSPIVMNHLELIIGKDAMRKGLQKYLKKYSYGNSTYKDLISILSETSGRDLGKWSGSWLDNAGMPKIEAEVKMAGNGINSLRILQSDPEGKKRLWDQKLEVTLYSKGKPASYRVNMNSRELDLTDKVKTVNPDFIILNGGSYGYGTFIFDDKSREWLLSNLGKIEDPLLRGTAWLNLWENFLNRKVKPEVMLNTLLLSLRTEKNQLIINHMLSGLLKLYWNFITPQTRELYSAEVEGVLWKRFTEILNTSSKTPFFRAYIKTAQSWQAIEKLKSIWSKKTVFKNFRVSSDDFTTIAYELAIREAPGANTILYKQQKRIKNREKKAKMAFISRSLSKDYVSRAKFFESLKNKKNREKEPWVNVALHYLHHPLRREMSTDYILPSLELLEEIKRTGDIFFPINWTNSILKSHNSKEAAEIVRNFLKNRLDYPENLKLKILQAADSLFRASELH